ncbi:NADH-quinone oxidoreductase subunit J [Oryzisolibacter sp. LB2S]|uniref:NADH-quinone oxidoreductase subunit J n=1 Tax=Alicycliphilus soli TaxID=3228789 RepID=UPI003457DB5C
MDVKTGFFYLFSAVLLFAAFRVVTARNPVHAVLHLILAFTQAAGIWLLLKAEFLAIALVLVYLGAVMVLFLFVVMMLDIRFDIVRKGFWNHFPMAALIGALIAFEMAAILMTGFRGVEEAKPAPALLDAAGQVLPYSNTQALGRLMYTEYLYPVEVAAVILLVAMIAAIALTLRERKDVKANDATAQLRARASERLVMVKMPVTQAAQEPAPVEGEAASAQEKKA